MSRLIAACGRASSINALSRGVKGMTIGVVDSEWRDATEPVQRAGRAALAALEKEGAKLVNIRLELAKYAAAIGYVIIAGEARARHRVARHNVAGGPGPTP